MSYDIPDHVRQGVKIMFKVADAEVMELRKQERRIKDQGDATWGYVAHELPPMLGRVQCEIEIGLRDHDIMPVVRDLQAKIDVYEESGDQVKEFFAKAVKAMLHYIDPNQYPEMEAVITPFTSGHALV